MGQALKSNYFQHSSHICTDAITGFVNGDVKDLLLTALDIRVSHAPLGNGACETQTHRKVQSAL